MVCVTGCVEMLGNGPSTHAGAQQAPLSQHTLESPFFTGGGDRVLSTASYFAEMAGPRTVVQ